MQPLRTLALFLVVGMAYVVLALSYGDDFGDDPAPLNSWVGGEGAPKQKIIDFVTQVTTPETAMYLPPERRVATIDVDGTILVEKPDYMEVLVAAHHFCTLQKAGKCPTGAKKFCEASCNSDWSVIDPDVDAFLLTAFLNKTQGDYIANVEDFLTTDVSPIFNATYDNLVYLPMVELLNYLVENEFRVYLVSGSEQGFVRGLVRKASLPVSPGHVISQTVNLAYQSTPQPKSNAQTVSFLRQDAFRAPSVSGNGKAEVIREVIGERPVLAFGNTMGDAEMLTYATSDSIGLGLVLNHDNPMRECQYTDQDLLDKAKQMGWSIVSMKKDFAEVFANGIVPSKPCT